MIGRRPPSRPVVGAGPEAEPRDAVMQRVRIGITGLAAVFLLTLLAAASLSFFSVDRRNTGNSLANAEAAPKEPLAELGIAPGDAPAANGTKASSSRPLAIAPALAPPDTVPVPQPNLMATRRPVPPPR